MNRPDRSRLRPVVFAVLALAGCGGGEAQPQPAAWNGTVGLYSSLPVAWNESADIRDALADEAPPHWALSALRSRGKLAVLDALANGEGKLPLPADAVLVLAQPRPLAPSENVALDAWVQAGGRVLLFADPMLTGHSLFAPGDPRRPQDIAMLSPILARWGLAQEFDDEQLAGERMVALPEGGLPVNLPGRFRILGKTGGAPGAAGDAVGECQLEADGLLADCAAGKGRIFAVSDAALLENPDGSADIPARTLVLMNLLDRLGSSKTAGK